MARIFLTGGAGFIGRNAIATLIAQQHSIVALQRITPIEPIEHPLLTIISGNLNNEMGTVRAGAHECDVLLYLAGDTTPVLSADSFGIELQANLLPLMRLLEEIRDTAIKRVVFVSSGGTVYGQPQYTPIDENHPTEPTTPYGLGKLTAEHLIRMWCARHGREYILLRAANPYGPYQLGRNNQGVISVWLQKIINGQPLVIWGNGEATRDYLYIDDLTEALAISCSNNKISSGIYNLGGGEGASLLQIAEAIAQATGTSPQLEFKPNSAAQITTNILLSDKFRGATGWHAQTCLYDGIARTYEFLKRKTLQ